MIAIGDTLPEVTLFTPSADGPQEVTPSQLFAGKKAVLFAVPGAYTPTCHQNHLPGYLENLDALKAKGIELVACVSVNDVFVMSHWGDATGATGKITMLADGSAAFATALGLELDLVSRGLGVRSKRYSMLIEDNVLKALHVEDSPATADASGAKAMLDTL